MLTQYLPPQVAAENDAAAEMRGLRDAADLAKQRIGQLEEHNKTLLDQVEAAARQRSAGEGSGMPWLQSRLFNRSCLLVRELSMCPLV